MVWAIKKKAPVENVFSDGAVNLVNQLAQTRAASYTNKFVHDKLGPDELKAIMKTGVYNKILMMKTGAALAGGSFIFEAGDEKIWVDKLRPLVKEALIYQLALGRGIIALCSKYKNQMDPLTPGTRLENLCLRVFDSTLISCHDYDFDLFSPFYYKPRTYMIRGESFHYTRIIDFTYFMPTEDERPSYKFAGIPEPEMIYEQLMNDAIVQRASGSIIDKITTIFYKLKGFKESLEKKQSENTVKFFSILESIRSIFGAGLIDAEDDIQVITQTLTGMKDLDESSLRRLAMVTGIPVPFIMGENVRGLNSSGDTEREVYNSNIANYRENYVLPHLKRLFYMLGMGQIEVNEATNLSAVEQVNYEGKVIDNALKLANIGADFDKYLAEKGIVENDPYAKLFGNDGE